MGFCGGGGYGGKWTCDKVKLFMYICRRFEITKVVGRKLIVVIYSGSRKMENE